MRSSNSALSIAGPDGIAMLLLSTAVAILTAGFSFAWALAHTLRVARRPWQAGPAPAVLLTLGKRIEGGAISHDYKLRLDKTLSLYSESENIRILIVGGRTGGAELSEAEAGRDYLVRKGVEAGDILLEDKSHHTLENLQEARKILSREPGGPVALITNRYHLARCGQLARGLGIAHSLHPAEQKLELNAATALKLAMEAFYMHWYIVGKIYSTVTKNEKMLNRIS